MNRLVTGIPGLDVVLGGGLEPGSTTVLAGAPGTGKTILAQQMCFANGAEEHRAIYYTTMSEPHSKLVRHLEKFPFFQAGQIGTRVEYLHLGNLLRRPGPDPLEPLVTEIVNKAMDEHPILVVIDSAKALRDFTDEQALRMAFYDLTSRLAHTDAALLLLGEYTPAEMAGGVEFSLADSIIQLVYEPREPIDRRWIRVVKQRSSHHLEGKHTFRITRRGFEVFPRVETLDAAPAAAVTGRLGSGVLGLDALMGGGIGNGEATVVLGPSGIGKTILGLQFIAEGLAQDHHCLYVTFQDTADQLITTAAGFGWDLQSAHTDRRLIIQYVPLGDLDLDILATGIRQELARGPVHRVVIDSLAELVFAAREDERFPAYARSLTGLVRAAGATLLITSETTALGPSAAEPASGVAFLFHNLILLRYIELEDDTGRALNIVKMRNSCHSTRMHQFVIDADGLSIGDPIGGASGVLGWSALRA